MITLHVEAETITELKAKVFVQLELALGDTVINQPAKVVESPNEAKITSTPAAPLAGLVSSVKRVRRSAAQIAADNAAKEEPVHAARVAEEPVVPADLIGNDEETVTVDDCKNYLRKIIAIDVPTKETPFPKAQNLLASFGIKKVADLLDNQYVAFAKAAKNVLGVHA